MRVRLSGGPVPPGEEELTSMWDFTHEDRQPGLAGQVWRAMRGTPMEKLSPEVKARVTRWQQAKRDDD